MPRARKPGAQAPKSRSRNGCWPCKGRKVKCGEEHPSCLNCLKLGDTCDYNIRLNWGGRRTKRPSQSLANPSTPTAPKPQQHLPSEPSLSLKRSHTFPTIASSSSTTVCGPYHRTSPVLLEWPSLEQGDLEYKDGTSHVPRAVSSSSLFGKGASSAPVPVPAAVMTAWSPLGRQVKTFSSPLADDLGMYIPAARHHRAKSLAEVSDAISSWQSPIMSSPSSHNTGSPCPPLYMARHGYSSVSHGSPATPTVSIAVDEDGEKPSLLLPPPMPPFHESGTDAIEAYSFYGFDIGARDRDIGRNDDAVCVPYIGLPACKSDRGVHLSSNSFRAPGAAHRGVGGYYDGPVPILIPRHLEPLPEKLKENRMNLLYFHHFINHTARVFVPYDDLRSNPFYTLLPQIAINDDTLLSLLLAYSASHRARVLQQNEPEMRMATWVEDIFPALRQTLNDDDGPVSDAKLATAIMLASLEIISPAAFGFDIPWQRHLGTARGLMSKRIRALAGCPLPPGEAAIASFLWSWLAYLSVMGSLSGGASGETHDWEPLLPMLPGLDQDPDEIDCIMGFSLRCLSLLSQVARLIRHRENQYALDGGRDLAQDASRLDQDLRSSMLRPCHPCRHVRPGVLDTHDRDEIVALNEAFHLAGLVHLNGRVLDKPASHPDVAVLVGSLLQCLGRVRRGGSAEAAMLFPMFIAGCDVPDDARRGQVLERFRSVETSGMMQVRGARRLMEKAWVLGRPWETLMTTEFIG